MAAMLGKTLIVLGALCALWLWVQRAWLRGMPGQRDPDALAGRISCRDCRCGGGICQRSAEHNEGG